MTTRYSEEFLGSLDPEVAELAREQQADDNDDLPTERIGRERVLHYTPLQMEEMLEGSPDNTQQMFADEEEDLERDLSWIEATVAEQTPALREAYDVIFVQGLTLRDGAHRLNISYRALTFRIESLKSIIAAAAPEGFLDADN